MNGVIGMNDLLLATPLSDTQRAYAEQVAHSGAQMLAIINDILDIAKIETGHLELDLGRLRAPRKRVEQACSAPRYAAHAKELAFDLGNRGADARAWVHGDSRRLRQVLLELVVANAVKFTGRRMGRNGYGSGSRGSPESDQLIRSKCRDSGIGIEPSTPISMFDPFTQADASVTRTYGGTGLGLAIARGARRADGRTIGVESKPGAGSTFWFESTPHRHRRPRRCSHSGGATSQRAQPPRGFLAAARAGCGGQPR